MSKILVWQGKGFYNIVTITTERIVSDDNSFPTPPSSQQLTCSGLRPISMDRTLEKKLANSGLRGGSFWRKPYSFINNFSSSPNLSLIWLTSDVSSSHDMLGYLENKHWSLHFFKALLHEIMQSKSYYTGQAFLYFIN